ncbi:uncharacterized protein L203_105306 [Cryptococcus depauperatus CBS 7841]|uniref:Uncharacterized protein n=1 Tax=Cryptococcus depauperatus CBS 7841 TaxID=1295531 RepID=A0A1E3HYS6_9TREE|nr:hypothetical protein L203_05676 [Cryptococcus depauperatus CBS 7841]
MGSEDQPEDSIEAQWGFKPKSLCSKDSTRPEDLQTTGSGPSQPPSSSANDTIPESTPSQQSQKHPTFKEWGSLQIRQRKMELYALERKQRSRNSSAGGKSTRAGEDTTSNDNEIRETRKKLRDFEKSFQSALNLHPSEPRDMSIHYAYEKSIRDANPKESLFWGK